MSQVRGNFSNFAKDLEWDTLGKHLADWPSAASVKPDHRGGGFLHMSFASGLSGAGFLQVSAFEILASTLGVTFASNILGGATSGMAFRWAPINIMDMSFGSDTSTPIWASPTATQGMVTADSITTIRFMTVSTTGGSGPLTSASNVSVHVIIFGLIISAPDSIL